MKKFLIIFFVVLAQVCAGQNPQWIVYNQNNSGLPTNITRSIVIDTNNVKWISTLEGLTRFDGKNWTVYDTNNSPLPVNRIIYLAVDKLNNIWMTTLYNGLIKFDGISNWTVYDTLNSGIPSNYTFSIHIDKFNNKWIGTSGGGVYKYNDTVWTVYNTSNSGLPQNVINVINTQGHIKWIGTYSAGVARFNDTSWIIYNFTNSGLPSNDINDIQFDLEGNKWICTSFGGIAKFNDYSNMWAVYNRNNSPLTTNHIFSILIDKQNVKWIGTLGSGLFKFDDILWGNFFSMDKSVILDIELDSLQNLWFTANSGYNNGVYIFNENGIVLVSQINEVVVSDFELLQNYPNPFNGSTSIEFKINKKGNVRISIYDLEGRFIEDIENKILAEGKHTIFYSANNLSSSVYFYKMSFNGNTLAKKFIHLK